jgi:hypothetical protein
MLEKKENEECLFAGKCGNVSYISNDAVFMRKSTYVKRSNRPLYGTHVLIHTKWRHAILHMIYTVYFIGMMTMYYWI